jgi:hypothetical protein
MISRSTACAAVAAVVAGPLLGATAATAVAEAESPPSRQELAKQILADNGIKLLGSHVGGQNDPESTARQNIVDTSKGDRATSPWSDVGVTKVQLSPEMLSGMVSLGKDFDYRVTTVAGGDHSPNSYHYKGTAFDIDQIDGGAVSASNPKVSKVKSACKQLGAVEILGPGAPGHDSHVHCAWKR